MRVVAPPRRARASIPPVIELDEPTVVDEIHDHAVVPPLPPPPPAAATGRRRRADPPTQIVEPLPAPPRDTEPHGRILDTESTGGQISGEVSNAAPLPAGRSAPWRRSVVGLACVAVLVGSVIGLAIGRLAREAAAIAAPREAAPALPMRAAPAGASRVIVEELPPPASAEPRPSLEPAANVELEMAGDPEPVVAKPARSRHRAASATMPRPAAGHRAGRSKALTYDPDALFLKRP